jgi:predicted  nucleic acid-binding Zn-ribbon protein
MALHNNIEKLEATIDRLLENHERMKTEKEAVEKRLREKESEWHHLKGQIRQYERERLELRERLDKIIGQFANLQLAE